MIRCRCVTEVLKEYDENFDQRMKKKEEEHDERVKQNIKEDIKNSIDILKEFSDITLNDYEELIRHLIQRPNKRD